jgi:hypothetical protein
VQSYHKDPQFETLFKLLSDLGIRDAHLRALDDKPTYLVRIQSAFTDLIGGIDSFDTIRLKIEPGLCDQLRSIVLTLLQAQVIVCWLFLIYGSQSNIFPLHCFHIALVDCSCVGLCFSD